MGIRISKAIGCFLTQQKVEQLFVSNYEEILEELDQDDEKELRFFETVVQLTQNGTQRQRVLCEIEAQSLLRAYQNKKIHYYDVIRSIYFYDDFQGFLFGNESQALSRRHDDEIDYYEAEDMSGSIRLLHQAIYPCSGYVYLGGLNKQDESLFEKGKTYAGLELQSIAMKLNKKRNGGELDLENRTQRGQVLTESGYFHPAVDELMFLLAKASGVLKPEVTAEQFNSALEPAIATYWG